MYVKEFRIDLKILVPFYELKVQNCRILFPSDKGSCAVIEGFRNFGDIMNTVKIMLNVFFMSIHNFQPLFCIYIQ